MLYDTRALLRDEWLAQRAELLADGWEYFAPVDGGGPDQGVVFIRKHISGEKNIEKGWHKHDDNRDH